MIEQEPKHLTRPESGEIEHRRVEQLLLDEENPRLNLTGGPKSQDELVRTLWDEMAVEEVALSIAANGYFGTEPCRN